MRRLNVIELEDMPWFPESIRNYMTDLLNFIITFFRIYDPAVPILHKFMRLSLCNNILDLCSGGSGAICRVKKILNQDHNFEVNIILSDLYPNKYACERIEKSKDKHITYRINPIDATQVPEKITGFRTLFTSFHHFDPPSAKKILADAIKQQRGIAIFEFTERNWRGFFGPLCLPLLVILVTPFLKPFSLKRLFFTYIIPFVPLAFIFDGIMSQLRSYTHEEMLAFAHEVDDGTYVWEAGALPHKFLPFKINYLVGYKS
jgi:hypothetical protein